MKESISNFGQKVGSYTTAQKSFLRFSVCCCTDRPASKSSAGSSHILHVIHPYRSELVAFHFFPVIGIPCADIMDAHIIGAGAHWPVAPSFQCWCFYVLDKGLVLITYYYGGFRVTRGHGVSCHFACMVVHHGSYICWPCGPSEGPLWSMLPLS